jgi:hypothetical protein
VEYNGYRCLTANNSTTQKAFLSLPGMLYKKDCPQNKKTEKQLLNGTHILSKDMDIFPFVVVNAHDKPVCRCLVTCYDGTEDAYVGFFESYEDVDAVKKMLTCVIQRAHREGKTRLVGPIDASIYINYRFKTNKFDETYTGEPYNKSYYQSLWESCGFSVSDNYVSNSMRRVEKQDFDEKLNRIYCRYLERGYKFKSLDDDFEDRLEDVYELLMDRFSEFKGYQRLSKEQFISMFSHLEKIADGDMMKFAYKDDKLKGFCLALPNYGYDTLGEITPMKLFNILKKKNNPSEYVILYAGADKKAPGLGAALMHLIRNELYENQCTSIAALIHEGNMPGQVYTMLHTGQYKYVLMDMNIPTE